MPDMYPLGLVDLDRLPSHISVYDPIPLKDGRFADVVDLKIPIESGGFIKNNNLAEDIIVTVQWNDATTNVRLEVTMPLKNLMEIYIQGQLEYLDSYNITVVV